MSHFIFQAGGPHSSPLIPIYPLPAIYSHTPSWIQMWPPLSSFWPPKSIVKCGQSCMISIILGGNMFSFLPFLNALGTFQKFISFSVAFEDSSLQLVIWLAFLQIPMQGLMKAGKQMILFPQSVYLLEPLSPFQYRRIRDQQWCPWAQNIKKTSKHIQSNCKV